MRKSEQIALSMVKAGIIKIDSEGRAWRTSDLRYLKGRGVTRIALKTPRLYGSVVKSGGYIRIGILQDGHSYHVQLNRLVFIVTNGTINDDLVVDHIDFDPSNNRPDNLQQITYKQNTRRSMKAGRFLWAHQSHCKLSDKQILEIRSRPRIHTHQKIADEFGVSRVTIKRIRLNKTYYWLKDQLVA